MRFQKITLLISALLILFASSCSSEYHWIKLKSADPQQVKKVDIRSEFKNSEELERQNELFALNPKTGSLTPVRVQIKDHGMASITRESILEKSLEIEKGLDPVRKSEIQSSNSEIRKMAIQKTLHEQLIKDSYFSKLSANKQLKLENKLSQKITAKTNPYRGGRGVNALLVLGLILLLLSLLFIGSGTLAVIGVLFAVILIILGLVQGLL